MTTILGTDEAGKGPVIGPMVIAAVMIDKEDEHKLKSLGVKDSKLLSPTRRRELEKKIKETVMAYKILVIPPEDIDAAVESSTSNLNKLEMARFALLINKLSPDEAYIDTPSHNTEGFRKRLSEIIKRKEIKLVCKNKADSIYPVVAAASILAKVRRDDEIEKLKKKFNVEFGSGYPADPFTKQFLQENYDKYPFFRKSWATWKNCISRKSQTNLAQF